MPALVTATVLYWTIQGPVGSQRVVLEDIAPIRVVVGDAVSNTDHTPIIAEYIDQKKRAKLPNWESLVLAARDGLLQVVDVHRTVFTTPAVPPNQPGRAPAVPAGGATGGSPA